MVRLINIHKFSSSEPQPYMPISMCLKLLHVQRCVVVVHAAVAGTERSRHGTAVQACARELHVTLCGDGLIIMNFINFLKKTGPVKARPTGLAPTSMYKMSPW